MTTNLRLCRGRRRAVTCRCTRKPACVASSAPSSTHCRRRVMRCRRRNKRLDAPHVRLYRWLLDSPAYLSLTCPARAVLIEIARAYDGFNNGRIGLSVRRASERCNIARGTASRAFVELQDRGFIECATKGGFNRKLPHASEWKLTFWAATSRASWRANNL
jgi:hypothetical protein